MTKVDKIKEVRILRHIEGLPIREIMRRVKLSRNTVRKILRSNATKFTYQRGITHQPVTGKVRGIIEAWIREDQPKQKRHRRTITRIYEILRDEYDYAGTYVSLAKYVGDLRKNLKSNNKEVYIPLVFSPGEAFQFDWSEVWVYLSGKLTKLQLAVTTLCYSRYPYLRVYPCQKQELMLDAQQRAFEYFGGVCKRGIYDNLKTAVKTLLKGHHRNLQEKFNQFCSHYLYQPQFCTPAKGNEKGRVENLIGYVKRNFFTPVPHFNSIEELNSRLLSFARGRARTKRHPELSDKSCYEVFQEEKNSLIQLPYYNFECCRVQHSIVSSLSTVAFDDNRYSVPMEYKDLSVLIKGSADEVIISHGGEQISRHPRSYEKSQQILNPYHYLGVLARKPGALRNGLPFRNWQLPEVFGQYRRLLRQKYEDADVYFAKTLVLLRDWPLKEVTEAIKKALSLGVLGDSYVLSLLKKEEQPRMDREYISVRIELERYKARQKPPDHYDRVLRFRGWEEVNNK